MRPQSTPRSYNLHRSKMHWQRACNGATVILLLVGTALAQSHGSNEYPLVAPCWQTCVKAQGTQCSSSDTDLSCTDPSRLLSVTNSQIADWLFLSRSLPSRPQLRPPLDTSILPRTILRCPQREVSHPVSQPCLRNIAFSSTYGRGGRGYIIHNHGDRHSDWPHEST